MIRELKKKYKEKKKIEKINNICEECYDKKMRGELDDLRKSMKEIADVNVDHLIDRLNLAPFKV